MVVQSDDIEKSMKSFKQYTAKALLELLKKENVKMILDQLRFYKGTIKFVGDNGKNMVIIQTYVDLPTKCLRRPVNRYYRYRSKRGCTLP